MRLSDVERAYGAGIDVRWRTFPLIADARPGRRSTPQSNASRARAATEEPRAGFVLPPEGTELPSSSTPALTAAKAAELQGRQVFAALHERIFAAHFRAHADIGRADVLWRLAQEIGLDMPRFERDCAAAAYEAVLHDYAEAVAWFGVSALPTVILNEKISLVGAHPTEHYHLLIDWILAGEPGGVIPLPLAEPDSAAPGQSPVSLPGNAAGT